MPCPQRLRPDHASEVLAFEPASPTSFAASVSEGGNAVSDVCTARSGGRRAGAGFGRYAYDVLVADGGSLLDELDRDRFGGGTAEVGDRAAEPAAARGVATAGVRELCRPARATHGVWTWCARALHGNEASRRAPVGVGSGPGGEAGASSAPAGGERGRESG